MIERDDDMEWRKIDTLDAAVHAETRIMVWSKKWGVSIVEYNGRDFMAVVGTAEFAPRADDDGFGIHVIYDATHWRSPPEAPA